MGIVVVVLGLWTEIVTMGSVVVGTSTPRTRTLTSTLPTSISLKVEIVRGGVETHECLDCARHLRDGVLY